MVSKTALKIGIDLDNTLINYDQAFLLGAQQLGLIAGSIKADKNRIRDYLRSKAGGEMQWQSLQGQVYGRFIGYASLFDGAYRFLWRCRHRGIIVEVVSHKTEYGHGDENKVPLRESAIDFLKNHNIEPGRGSLLQNIYFENTRDEKVRRIIDNKYDWFIDDLPEVLADLEPVSNLRRILFSESGGATLDSVKTCRSWSEIANLLLGDWTRSELHAFAETVSDLRVKSVEWVGRGGNSGLLQVVSEDEKKYALKLYPSGAGTERLNAEFNGLSLIRKNKLRNVSVPFRRHLQLNAAVYEWIEGKAVARTNSEHMRQALDFLKRLHSMRTSADFSEFKSAASAMTSASGFEDQLHARYNLLCEAAVQYPDLAHYLQSELLPVMTNILSWIRAEWKVSPGYDEVLPRSKQTLSPSDFGFHNAIETSGGELVFIDFEYFGWDDPAKLVADFDFHPGMAIDPIDKKEWFAGAIDIYGEEIVDRLRMIWPMIGLSWCLIMLNEFRDDIWLRRCSANVDKLPRRDAILVTQLKRSHDLLTIIGQNYMCPPILLNGSC